MDDLIAIAEREAAAASQKAEGAAKYLQEWTQGERTVITNLKRMGTVISGAEFQQVTSAFVEQHRSVFEFTDENKFEYSALHEQYVELMEKTLIDLAKEVDMDELLACLPEFMQARRACARARSRTRARPHPHPTRSRARRLLRRAARTTSTPRARPRPSTSCSPSPTSPLLKT